MPLYGNNYFGYIQKLSALGGSIATGSKYYWHQKMLFNLNPQPTTLTIKTNTPFKYPCLLRYINYDYEVVLSGNVTLEFFNLMLKSWQGVNDGAGIGTNTSSYNIQLQAYDSYDTYGRVAKGCVLSQIDIKHTANLFVEADFTFMCKSITGLKDITSSLVTPPTTTCQDYLRDVNVNMLIYPAISTPGNPLPSFNLSFQTEWADKLLTQQGSVLTNPIWTTKNVVLNLDFLVPSGIASPVIGTVWTAAQNSNTEAYTIQFKKNANNHTTINVNDVRITGLSLPDPEKGIWQGSATYLIVSGIDSIYDLDNLIINFINA